jgi:Uma2 family endonuclease
MVSPAPKRMTLAEFLEWDDGTDRRYELLDGMLVMMAPSLEAHGELALALGAEIRARLRPPCRVISEAGITIPDRADTYYVADLAVTCAPREPGRRMVFEAVLVVEVLSPSTSQVDRWRKVADYRTLSSVQEILVVFSDERRVEVQRRTADGWRVEDLIGKGEIELSCCDRPILLDAVYDDVLADHAKVPNMPNAMSRNVALQDFDRLPSIMFHKSAADYIMSSQLLNDKRNELDTHFGMPPFFLCGHAFELLLKAFLRAKGWPVTKLKRSHDLSKLYEQAMGEGLQNNLDQNDKAQLDLLASLGISPHFLSRYPQTSGLFMPKLLDLYQIYGKLKAQIEPVVEADFERERCGIIGDRS